MSNNIVVGTTGAELQFGSDYGNGWPKQQMILLPDSPVFEHNRVVATNHADPAMLRLERQARRGAAATSRAVLFGISLWHIGGASSTIVARQAVFTRRSAA